MSNLKYALRNCTRFSQQEQFRVILLSVVLAPVLFMAINQLGLVSYDFVSGMVIHIIIFMIVYLLFVSSQKFLAAFVGLEAEFKIWIFGPLISIFLAFYSFGYFPFLYLGTVGLKPVERMRLGKYYTEPTLKEMLLVGIFAPFMLLVFLLVIILPLYFITDAQIFKSFILVSAAILFFSSLPLPRTNGLNVLIKSRTIWLIYVLFTLVFLFLILPLQFYAYLVALPVAFILFWVIRAYLIQPFL